MAERLLHATQRNLFWLLIATYVAGAVWPTPGARLRGVTVAIAPWVGPITAPMAMLGALLLVAGLGARLEQLRNMARRPALLIAGLFANTLYPIAFALATAVLVRAWRDRDEAESILVGLAMIGAMPIAGSSTAWTQNAAGNVALALGLVWGSTLLSPLVTPLGLHAVGLVTHGDYSEDLHELAAAGASSFVTAVVVVPSLCGVALRALVGPRRVAPLMPVLQLANLGNLLALNYANAAVGLSGHVTQPDWDFLALAGALSAAMCAGAFAVGWGLPALLAARRADRLALTFGLGMSNNGTGLVLAAAALGDHPLVLLPIVLYNLAQQLAAGVVDALSRRAFRARRPPRTPRRADASARAAFRAARAAPSR